MDGRTFIYKFTHRKKSFISNTFFRDKRIGQRIRIKRIELKMTLLELGLRCGWGSYSMICLIERTGRCNLAQLEAIAKELEVETNYLIDGYDKV